MEERVMVGCICYVARALLLVVVLAAACAPGGQGRPSTPPAGTYVPTQTPSAGSIPEGIARGCPVAVPGPWDPPAGVSPDALFGAGNSYGNGKLWVGGLGDGGVIVATSQEVEKDGSVGWKFGWWRQPSGVLTITGRRLGDGSTAPLRVFVPRGYGRSGFQASGVYFPTEGCWEVTGEVGATTLTFVTFVIKEAA